MQLAIIFCELVCMGILVPAVVSCAVAANTEYEVLDIAYGATLRFCPHRETGISGWRRWVARSFFGKCWVFLPVVRTVVGPKRRPKRPFCTSTHTKSGPFSVEHSLFCLGDIGVRNHPHRSWHVQPTVFPDGRTSGGFGCKFSAWSFIL